MLFRSKYRQLRDRYHGGYTFDFSERVLTGIAENYGVSGDFAKALGFVNLNLEFFPQSSRTYVLRAQVRAEIQDIEGARVLCLLGDSVTTDHISPAGAIALDGPAAKYLEEHGVSPRDFNSYGSRRGNHGVMMRGTFANSRLRNLLAPGTEGGVTRYLPKLGRAHV